MGFLTIFYKYIIKSHKRRFISVQLGNGEGVLGDVNIQYLKQIKYQMLVVVDSNHILRIYNPAIFYCHRTSPCDGCDVFYL